MSLIDTVTVEHLRILNRLQLKKNHHNDKVADHNLQLQKYMDARERLNNSRRRNRQKLNETIDYHMAQMMHHQEKAEEYTDEIRIIQNLFQQDGRPGTPEDWVSRIRTTVQARIDLDNLLRSLEEPEIKQEPTDDDIKQEPADETEVKQEVAMPNVIKSEPQ